MRRSIALRDRRSLACAWFAASLSTALACAAHAQEGAADTPAETSSSAAPEAPAAPDAAPPPPPDTPAPLDAARVEPPAAAPLNAEHEGELALARSLASIEYDQRHTHMLLPWVVTAVGAVAMMTGLVLGANAALNCSDSCKSSFWPGWIVIAGATIAEAGTVWVLIKKHSSAELQLRHDQLEEELQRMHWNTVPRSNETAHAALSVRAAF